MVKYTIHAMTAHPLTLTMNRLSLRSRRFCFFRCPSIRSACSGVKSEFILSAVLSSSAYGQRKRPQRFEMRGLGAPLLGFRREYVTGIVTKLVMVRMK
jgi:hypothetical protein